MRIDRCYNVDDFRLLAKRRLPAPLFHFLDGGAGNHFPNNGLVRVTDARWGRFLGCVPADHFDEIGQLIGDRPGPGNSWRHLGFYADLVAFLRSEGF